MKKKISDKKKREETIYKLERDFVSFGNRKRVFWSITLATIIISLIGIPVMIQNEDFFIRFLIIWILEIIYIGMYVTWGRTIHKK
jgi:hypothetical protein